MNKALFILTIIIIIITFSACGGNTTNNNTNSSSTTLNVDQENSEQIDSIITPDFIGMNKNNAKENLEKLGFTVELQEAPEYDDKITDGNIVEQSLNEGTVVIKGTKIVLSYNSARFRWVYSTEYENYASIYNYEGEISSTVLDIPSKIDNLPVRLLGLEFILEKANNSIQEIRISNDVEIVADALTRINDKWSGKITRY